MHVVYDGVGKTTFDKGLNCLRPRGLMALYGAASGPVGAARSPAAQREGLALRHAPEPQPPHRRARGADPARRRRAGLDPRRQAQAPGGASVPAREGRRRAPRARGPQDDGQGPPDSGVTGRRGVAPALSDVCAHRGRPRRLGRPAAARRRTNDLAAEVAARRARRLVGARAGRCCSAAVAARRRRVVQA